MTKEEFRTYVRSLLSEPEASYWTDEEIDIYTKIGINSVVSSLYHLMYPYFSVTSKVVLPAGDVYLSVPTDCFKVVSIRPVDNTLAADFMYVPEHLKETYETNEDLIGWAFEGGQIRIFGLKSANTNIEFIIRYLPKFTDIEDLPEPLHQLVAIEAVIQAKMKDEAVPQYLLLLKQESFLNAVKYLTIQQFQNE